MFESIDIICSRRVPLVYVAPNFCEAEFSSTSEPIIVLSPLRRRAGPTGLRITNDGGVLTLSWDTVDGAICYNVYAVVGENYILVAECIPDPHVVVECADPDGCTYVVTVITPDGESEPSDPIETPGEVCLLRIVNYGSIAQPLFVPDPTSPVSTDPEWDGIWNLLNTAGGDPNDYWYSDADGNFGPAPFGPGNPAISIQGRGDYCMLVYGPLPANPDIAQPYWGVIIGNDPSTAAQRVWVGFKIGGDISSPQGVYVNGEVSVPTLYPPGSWSDGRLSVQVEFCSF